jgi:hypothetical protein
VTKFIKATVANSRTVIVPHPTDRRITTMLIPDPTGRTDGKMTTAEVPVQIECGPGSVIELSEDEARTLRAAGYLLPEGEAYRERVPPPEVVG